MKRTISSLGLLLLSLAASAQPPIPFCSFSVEDGWSDRPPNAYIHRRSEYIVRQAKKNDPTGIPDVIVKIKGALDISVPIDIYIARDENNAFATVANGRKIIVADTGFLAQINSISRTEWGAIQVLAHEVGHHIAGFDSDSHRGELNADYWSGQVLQRLGAARSASTKAILAFGTDFDTKSHPAKNRRARVIEKGWDDAARNYIDYSYCISCR